jgi:hypothetical protein
LRHDVFVDEFFNSVNIAMFFSSYLANPRFMSVRQSNRFWPSLMALERNELTAICVVYIRLNIYNLALATITISI